MELQIRHLVKPGLKVFAELFSKSDRPSFIGVLQSVKMQSVELIPLSQAALLYSVLVPYLFAVNQGIACQLVSVQILTMHIHR